ncbi:DUF4397 domain-containing protein [Mucilaginibacter pallidiroseus]|uniref:DUF4397 domain-containing protein n=1 Tax=Mucilaginibacter pallidiroseus TaxID=2599295 RepID=A0A563UDI1_9SPHI|nr:DUF4397 domain-containing protein [Mucilaginibacter pallidiroseus]TWR29418.1 DUF4397 domain-containing protein [Mucilaginibacter pallidiroseus]
MLNRSTLFLSLLVIAVLASCKKDGDDSLVTIPTGARLNVINATNDTLNYYLNGTRINNTSSLYPLGTSGYILSAVGENNYQFKKFRNAAALFSLPLALDSGRVYSLFVTGQSAESTILTADTLAPAVPDNLNRPRVRFVNTSPQAGNLDVLVGDTVNFKVRAFKSVSVFLPVNPGNKRVRIYKSGTGALLSDEIRVLNNSRVYTLFSKGTPGSAGNNAFATGLVINQ